MTTLDLPDLREKLAKVMGWKPLRSIKKWEPFPGATMKESISFKDWQPDIDLNQAFMLVEKMREKGYRLSLNEDWDGKGSWLASCLPQYGKSLRPGEALHINPATAICLAIEATEER